MSDAIKEVGERVQATYDAIRNAALEEAALVVDQCNREGPYNAIGAARRIRALKREA